MRSVSAVLAGAWLALLWSPPLLTGCANVLGLDGYGPEQGGGGTGPVGDPLGTPCESGDTCESGFCSDKLCCDQACDEACIACDMANLEGMCRPLVAGTNAIGCDGLCDGDGGCLVEGGTASLVGGPGDQRAHAVAAGDTGGFAVVGQFDTGLSFQAMPLPVFGGADAFVASFDAGGSVVFERSFGGAGIDTLFAVDVGPDGRVAAAGLSTSAAASFAGNQFAFTPPGDPIVLTWDSAGNELWLGAPSQANFAEVAYGVAFDDQGRVWVGGQMADADNLASDGFVNVYDAATGMEAFPPVRLGINGASSHVRAMAADKTNGRVLVAGTTDGPLDFPAVSEIGLGPEPDLFLIMFDSSGAPLWGHAYPAVDGRAVPVSVAFDDDGGFAVVGIMRGVNDFGGPTLMGNGADEDIFVASFTADGDHRFSQVYPAVGTQIGRTIAFDASGRIVVAGEMTGVFEFGPEAPILGVAGASDGYVGRLTAEGQHLASFWFGDPADQQIWGVTTTSDGVVRLVGWAAGAFEFFDTPLMSSDGSVEVLLMELPP